MAGLDAGELGLDAKHESAVETLDAIEAQLADLRRQELAAAQDRAALAARVEALHVGLNRKDASSALLAATDQVEGLLGSVAALVGVEAGYETAVAAAFGAAADAVAVAGLDAAVGAFGHLKAEDLGRAGLLLGGRGAERAAGRLAGAAGIGTVRRRRRHGARGASAARCSGCCARWRSSTSCRRPRTWWRVCRTWSAVTRDGDVLSAHFAAGGSSAQPSLIEVQAAIDEAEERLTEAGHRSDRLRFAQSQLEEQQRDARAVVEETLARLHESDAAMAALAEQLGQLGSTARSASEENERLAQAITRAEQARDSDISGLAELEHRLELAETTEEVEPDPGERDRLTEEARRSRDAEMEARLALRTLEERVRALAGRADALRKAATAQRQAQARELARRARVRREAETAAAVHAARGLPGRCGRTLAGPGRGGAGERPRRRGPRLRPR